MSDEIPPSVFKFLQNQIHSIAQLEILLAIQSDPQKAWSITEAAKTLYVPPQNAYSVLESLRTMGLLASSGVPDPEYRYSPQSDELRQIVDQLFALYPARRVTIINIIYSAPVQKLLNFADTFRFRRDQEG